MENMIVLPQLDQKFRLPKFVTHFLPDFERAESFSIKGQYVHPKYENGWVMAIRVEARELTHAGHSFLQDIYPNRRVDRTALLVHLCDLLKGDSELGDKALDDFEETVAKVRKGLEELYGWADVRPTSLLSVNKEGFIQQAATQLPDMHTMQPTRPAGVEPNEEEMP